VSLVERKLASVQSLLDEERARLERVESMLGRLKAPAAQPTDRSVGRCQ